jgi:DNA-directed RNA polymerase specialized sigma subunit
MAKEKEVKKENKKKKDTTWYNDLVKIYQDKKVDNPVVATAIRNILWEQIKNLLYSRVRDIIDRRKGDIVRQDPEFAKQLYQDTFFILQKAVDIWDPNRGTKFLTFLGDIADQEILNKIRLHFYHKTRDKKIRDRTAEEFVLKTTSIEEYEKDEMLDEMKRLFENYTFDTKLERDIVNLIVYGRGGAWNKLLKRSKMNIDHFYKLRDATLKKLRVYILENCNIIMRDSLETFLGFEVKDE